jgi:hypothetical protein
LGRSKSQRDSIVAVKEKLDGVDVDLTSLFCRHGANIYILTYQNSGVRKHTLVDAGDSRYHNRILSVLTENDINPANIERVIITHGHPDHYGLAYLLAKESGAKITVQASFRNLVEGETSQEERRLLGKLDPSGLKDCDMEYLRESDTSQAVNIGGVGFVRLTAPIPIGPKGRLEIIGCPESMVTHSHDQIIVLYSSRDDPHPHEDTKNGFRPTDDILFSGDLWLMRGPMFYHSITDVSWYWRYGLYRIKAILSGGDKVPRDPRNQDPKAKEALKKGFRLIRVKPGHGPEFLGTRILPIGLLAERDILVELGYPLNADKSIIRSPELAPKVVARRERAYTDFVGELVFWHELGYSLDEIAGLLTRIYSEQTGGGPLVKEDRQERRDLLKATLASLEDDRTQSDWIHQLARVSQSKLKNISY